MKDKKTFGSFIKEKRISKNYSQKDLAELLFVTESAVSKWERGVTYPDITLITDICKVLEISERELIQSSDDSEYRRIKSNSDRYNKIKKTLFWTCNICYIVAVIACFIVNLAVGHKLSWFFIVLTSLMVSYSFCPTITWVYDKFKKLIFIGSNIISLFFLFLTCSIYTNNYWFMIPTTGVLLGYFIVFYPILFTQQKKYLGEERYKDLSKWFLFSYAIGILLFILLLLISIYCYSPFAIGFGFVITVGCMALPIIIGIMMLFDKCKGAIKVVLLSLAGLVVLVSLISAGRAIYLKSTEKTETHLIDEIYSKVDIDVETDCINIYLNDEEKSEIVFTEQKNVLLDVKVENGTLLIKRIDERNFFEKIFSFGHLKLDLFLSEEMIESANIKCDTGDIIIHKGFTFENVKVNNSTGDITLKSNVSNTLSIKISTGDIRIEDCNNLGDVSVESKTGRVDILNANFQELYISAGTGNTKLKNVLVKNDFNMKGSTGSVCLDRFDAANIYVELSTGDVEGTILSSKLFIARSTTGYVNVPNTREGGECHITVSTGNINIKYE